MPSGNNSGNIPDSGAPNANQSANILNFNNIGSGVEI